ncbi:MAG: glycosyl hydrolase [Bacteroidota bacterium]
MCKQRLMAAVLLTAVFIFSHNPSFSQTDPQAAISKAAQGLTFRAIGPALMGGRISDIAVHPTKPSTWYVSAGSGNLWKTTNSGISWTPVFENQASYSIGEVAIDPNNPETVWVGTGENVSGRHVGWGDGVYKSVNGGKSWQNMGIKKSEHISKILIDPRNSEVVLVAAEGPLWSSGGDRGVYKTTNGGKTWEYVLPIDEHTGVTDLEFDPSNPDVIYAAAYQRRRKVWALLAGGPQSGIYKSTDNGNTWKEVSSGLPKGDMGKIGLAVTPANPDLVYATIEASPQEKGLYRSTDKGESWEKRSSYTSGGTGPHYYQELEASPQNPDLIYQMDVFLHVSRDGGKTFDYLGTGRAKHSDNHAMWIDPAHGNHMLVGTDAGVYESFDEGVHWRHFPNLPISQFYKLGLDNAVPFYNIVGGAQDLGTLIGPSRTLHTEGVRNQDWYVPLGADGYDSHFDPEDPDIVYVEIQGGLLHRLDRKTEEVINIQPQPAPNDPPERWNWDSPVLISHHNHKRLYFGSQRVWKSEDQGHSWTPISGDLTTNVNRYELDMIDRVPGVDALYDNGAMSKYATLTSIAESPQEEGLLYTGSDDGLIHVSEDGGKSWRKSAALPGVPERAFINDIEPSQHNANTVFAVADAHKVGDYSPYLFRSDNRGSTWKSISGDLPLGTILWVIKQDHQAEDLLFIGTEYGIYFSYNAGDNWLKLKAGVPTIPFRDIELHARENDLVGASFGRGFYVMDDYSPLRELSTVVENKASTLFSVRDAWWYVPNEPMQAKGSPTLGSDSYVAENPPFGALFTYYLSEAPQTSKQKRMEANKSLMKESEDIPFPGWENLRAESMESKPSAMLLIKDEEGHSVRWLAGPAKKGLHRINWDLTHPAPDPINLTKPAFTPPWAGESSGPMVKPGIYTVALFLEHNGKMEAQGNPQSFTVKPIPTVAEGKDFQAIAAFQQQTSDLIREIASARRKLGEVKDQFRYVEAAMKQTAGTRAEHFTRIGELKNIWGELSLRLSGDPIRRKLDEPSVPSISSRAQAVAYGHWGTTQAPTHTHEKNIEISTAEFAAFQKDLKSFLDDVDIFIGSLEVIGAPYIKGRVSQSD